MDRRLPYDLDAEKALIASVILEPSVLDTVVTIATSSDFFDDSCSTIFGHIEQLQASAKPIDVRLLVERLRSTRDFEKVGGSAFMAKVASSTPTPAHAKYYANVVREKSIRRHLIDAARDIEREAFLEDRSIVDTVASAEAKVLAVAERESGAALIKPMSAILADVLSAIERRKQGDSPVGVETGIGALDRITGGMRGGELSILAGRTSMGKTALALNVAEHVAVKLNLHVLIVSLEMTAAELAERMLSSLARVDFEQIRHGRYLEDEHSRLLSAVERLAHAPLAIDEAPTRRMTEINAIARRRKRRDGLGLLIVDYLQLISPDNPREPRQEQVAATSRRMKQLARELQIPILCLSQLNRQPDTTSDKRPRLSHLRESGAIEQDSDVVLFAHRPKYYELGQEAHAKCEEAEVIVAKQRNGRTGSAKLYWLGSQVRFVERASGDDEMPND